MNLDARARGVNRKQFFDARGTVQPGYSPGDRRATSRTRSTGQNQVEPYGEMHQVPLHFASVRRV